MSTVTVTMQEAVRQDESLPQVWDELRRKVSDAQGSLPPGAGPSIVVDDFGDVFGVFVAVYGDEYSYAELYDVAKFLRREFLLVEDVAKVDVLGRSAGGRVCRAGPRSRIPALVCTPYDIVDELRKPQPGVEFRDGSMSATISLRSIPTGLVDSIEEIGRDS